MNEDNFNYNDNNIENNNYENESVNANAQPRINKSFLIIGLVACIIGIIGLCIFFVISVENDHKERNEEEQRKETYKKEDYDELTIKKKELYSVMEQYILKASSGVNNDLYGDLSNPNVLYYIPVSNIESKTCVEIKDGVNPLGEWGEAYVVVNYLPYQYTYDYYFTFYDMSGYSLPLTNYKVLSETGEDILYNGGLSSDTITNQTIDTISETYVLQKDPNQILTCYVR